MAISKIQYDDKVAINIDNTIPDINKCNASDLNEIKSVVNNNADEIPSNDNLVNVGTSVDSNYKVNVLTTKNLFDKDNINKLNAYFESSGGTIIENDYNRVLYIPCIPNTDYTFTQGTSSISNHIFQVATTNTKPEINTIVYDFTDKTNYRTFTYTTNATAKYLVIRIRGGDDVDTFYNGVQIEKGSTATTYEAFIPNTINVNNEKYTDTINVGTEKNNKNKVNMLYNKNLCNGISQILWISGSVDLCGVSSSSGGLYIKTNGGKYTISTIQTQPRYRVACIDTLPTSSQSVTAYNGLLKDNTNQSITIDTTGHNYLVVDATDVSKIQIEQGEVATTFELQKYSINVDTNEVYSKPVVLYENVNGTNGNITLSDNSNNYSYIEIFYGSGDPDIKSTRTLPGKNILLSTIDARTSVSQLYIRSALKNVSGTTLTNAVFSNVVNYGTMKVTPTTNEFRNENTIRIYRVLGYK